MIRFINGMADLRGGGGYTVRHTSTFLTTEERTDSLALSLVNL